MTPSGSSTIALILPVLFGSCLGVLRIVGENLQEEEKGHVYRFECTYQDGPCGHHETLMRRSVEMA